MKVRYPLFVKSDLDGFFGLFVDNLVQLLLIVALCSALCGMTGDQAHFIYAHILPGAAVSILIGNVFYAFQARRLARREQRADVTALPYGINTPSLLVYIFLVMQPVYQATHSARLAWQMGLLACLGSGLIEFGGSFVAEAVRRRTPRAALLSTLAGIAIGFIAMTFALQIFHRPLVAMLPLGVILVTYFAGVRFPLGLPGGLIAVVVGTALAWVLPADWTHLNLSAATVSAEWALRAWRLPLWAGDALWQALGWPVSQWIGYLSIIVAMGLFNIIGSLQNIESAAAGGDAYATRPSLAVNGLGTIAAALFGSCFPTTIYIGHPGWKKMGARAGYSTLNGLVITAMCLTGTVAWISSIVPMEAGIAIVLWIGVVITAQAFQATPPSHAPAVAVGLFPAIAAWGATLVAGAFTQAAMVPVAGGRLAAVGSANTMQQLLQMDHAQAGVNTAVNGFLVHALNTLQSGYIFTCMILAAISACLIDRRFRSAAVWSGVGCGLTVLGLMHAYQLRGNTVDVLFVLTPPAAGAFSDRAYGVAAGYALCAGLCTWCGRRPAAGGGSPEGPSAGPEPPPRFTRGAPRDTLG